MTLSEKDNYELKQAKENIDIAANLILVLTEQKGQDRQTLSVLSAALRYIDDAIDDIASLTESEGE